MLWHPADVFDDELEVGAFSDFYSPSALEKRHPQAIVTRIHPGAERHNVANRLDDLVPRRIKHILPTEPGHMLPSS